MVPNFSLSVSCVLSSHRAGLQYHVVWHKYHRGTSVHFIFYCPTNSVITDEIIWMMKLTEFACIEVKMNKEFINYVSISTVEISADIFITLHSQTRETHLKKKSILAMYQKNSLTFSNFTTGLCCKIKYQWKVRICHRQKETLSSIWTCWSQMATLKCW